MKSIMDNRERILRTRPFNMANFSGGSGYMPVFAILAMVISFPATVLIWAGMAPSLKKEDGTLDFNILKRRLNRILLPICLAACVLLVISFVPMVVSYGGSFLTYGLAIIWGAAIPTIGIYCAMFFSARRLNAKGNLVRGKWGYMTAAYSVLIIAIGFLALMFLFLPLGDSLQNLFR